MNQSKTANHPQRAAIDAMLDAGKSQRQVAATFGLSRDSVRRYDADRRESKVPTTAPPVGDLADATPLDLMREIVASLRATDPKQLSAAAQGRHFDTYRRAVETLGKLEPPASQATLTWDELMAIPLDAPLAGTVGDAFAVARDVLEPHPEIRAEIARRWKTAANHTSSPPTTGGTRQTHEEEA